MGEAPPLVRHVSLTTTRSANGPKKPRCRWAATHRHRDPADRLSQLPAGGSRHETFVNRQFRSDIVVIDAFDRDLEHPVEEFVVEETLEGAPR